MKQILRASTILAFIGGTLFATSVARATTATLNVSTEASVSEWNASGSSNAKGLFPISNFASGPISASGGVVAAEGKEPIMLPGPLPRGPKGPAGVVSDTGSTAALLGLVLVALAAIRRKVLRAA